MSPVAVSDGRRRLWRSRWAALGAAVAVTFGGGGLFAVSAASPESSVVTLEPVRILDTRDPVNVGLDGPFTSPVAQDLMVTGPVLTTTGTKTVVPTGATGVFLNVTPVGSTAAGFISVRPANATGLPSTSNVNFTVGAINPNAVLVELPVGGADDGKIEITFDAFGAAGPTSDVLVDVVGYTTDAKLKSLEARVAALEAAQPFALTAQNVFESVTATEETVVSVTVTAPVAGQATVFSTSALGDIVEGEETRCSITTGVAVENLFLQRWESGGPNTGQHAQLSGVRMYDVAAGTTVQYNLVCNHVGVGSSNMESTIMSVIFTPGRP
jgi:hypothetical protein